MNIHDGDCPETDEQMYKIINNKKKAAVFGGRKISSLKPGDTWTVMSKSGKIFTTYNVDNQGNCFISDISEPRRR